VIPGTALGVVFVVAAFGPGYLYLRVAERRSIRLERSGLLEAVELAVVGAFASTIALLIVAALADELGVINVHWLSTGPRIYFAHHPLRLLWLLTVSLGAAYGLAYLAARVAHRGQPASIVPGTAWTEAFQEARGPGSKVAVRATVELRDGRKIEGTLRGHSTEIADNRDLLLVAPLRAQAGPKSTPTTLTDAVVLLREADVVTLSARFVPGTRQRERKIPWWRRFVVGPSVPHRPASE
jgi:hypothetical protein